MNIHLGEAEAHSLPVKQLPVCFCLDRRVAPITPERKAQLAEEKRLLSQMRSHQRKIYHAEQEMVHTVCVCVYGVCVVCVWCVCVVCVVCMHVKGTPPLYGH